MEVQKIPVEKLLAAEYNPRKDLKPGDPEYEKLKRSLEQFGYVEPVIWNNRTGNIVGGHQRFKVLRELGVTEIDCVVVDIDIETEKAMNVALNKISGDWDKDKLMLLIADLQATDFDVSLTGFDPAEIDDLFKDSISAKEDNFDVDAELEKPAFSKAGDVWKLGRHRLVVGDSTKAETYETLMDGQKANLIVTDPPYNVNYEGTAGKIKNDNLSDDAFYNFLLDAFTCMEAVLADDGSIYVFHADTEGLNFRKAFHDAGFYLSGCCIWKKPKKNTDHPTMKPVELIAYPIGNSTLTNSIVLDPFGGSGSTLIACEQTERICRTIELDEKYADVIVNRYIELVGGSQDVSVIRDGLTYSYEEVNSVE